MTYEHLEALKASAHNRYNYDSPDQNLLERFDTPDHYGQMEIDISVPEFTSLCPLTGQPDFATIEISYIPDRVCVESKSLKLYMMSYRNHGAFHEACVSMIHKHLLDLLDPLMLTVVGEFTPRGGIPFHPTITYIKE